MDSNRSGGSLTGRYLVVELNPGVVIVELHGEHDLATMDEAFRTMLLDLSDRHNLVVVDLRETTFIDSSFLAVLISASRRARANGGRVRVHVGDGPLAGTFTRLRLAEHFDVALSFDEATRLSG